MYLFRLWHPGYRIGEFVFDPAAGELGREAAVTRLEPRVAEVLAVLIANAGRVVTRDQLLGTVWHNRIVVDESITRCISAIRAALDDRRPYRYLETLPKRGYRLIAPVTVIHRSPRVAAHPDDGTGHPIAIGDAIGVRGL